MNRRELLKSSALLMGYSISGSVFSGMLSGCQVDPSDDWMPSFFSIDQIRIIASIADHILPKTDTPGAGDVFVDRFVDQIVKATYTPSQREDFMDGLTAFQSQCRESFGDTFENLSKDQKDSFLTDKENTEIEQGSSLWGSQLSQGLKPDFYRQLKGLCLFGYFSSEMVGENVLSYDPVPGRFIGCQPLEEVGNAWSL